jgi:hypothetical protein
MALAQQDCEEIVVRDIELLMADDSPLGGREVQDGLKVRIHYAAKRVILSPGFSVRLQTEDGVELCRVSNAPISGYHIEEILGEGIIEVTFDDLPLTGGRYFLSLVVARANVRNLLVLEDVARFTMAARDIYGSGLALNTKRGYVTIPHRWRHWPGQT